MGVIPFHLMQNYRKDLKIITLDSHNLQLCWHHKQTTSIPYRYWIHQHYISWHSQRQG